MAQVEQEQGKNIQVLVADIKQQASDLNRSLHHLAEAGVRLEIYIHDRKYIGLAAELKQVIVARFWKEEVIR